MSYSNPFLADFTPVFHGILKAGGLSEKQLELVVIDEETENFSLFERADVKDVLNQLGGELNLLTIYTDRFAYFSEYARRMYEENGLLVMLFSKKELSREKGSKTGEKLILDFEWEGTCHTFLMGPTKCYIPIHKKPWKIAENLDIIIPVGYNIVIVKNNNPEGNRPQKDRFEAAFYQKDR